MISGILQYEFLQNAFLTGIIIGIIAPLIGVFVVVRRLSLIADASKSCYACRDCRKSSVRKKVSASWHT